MRLKTSVVIPNWQGKNLLQKNLNSVLKIGADEVIVVENGSTDGSLELLQTKYPQVKTIINNTNEGFARGVNRGVGEAIGDIIILLNTDVAPSQDLLKHVLPHFKNTNMFAVSFNEGSWAWARGYFNKGLIEHKSGEQSDTVHESFWASGGSAAFSRKKWNRLGGFNLLYEPFYWEDLDISYRAQLMGWEVLWDPAATVTHKHEVTVQKHSMGSKKDLISQRNQILFFWCNISSLKLWVLHLFWLPVRILLMGSFKPFLMAVSKIIQVIKFRMKTKRGSTSDESIFAKFI